ncbi:MAG: MBL fold metallo-hydrolase [Gammaproteobacteria bacterium]|nr:MBL fold metallo-hydrolase [Gammaproteobacteria bacterium]NCF81178.1 MBL fold metallo-hydrolase [Pseudomonadota bacterium]
MSVSLPFSREYEFEYGRMDQVAPMLRRVVARNPSPFTWHGTGTYVVGDGNVAVVDPGPDIAEHIDALLAALEGETITHLLVTHTHRDHSPACRAVQAATGARTYGFGRHGSGRIDAGTQVEEGADADFVPDVHLAHGDVVSGDGWSVECVHTPGHTSNHMCFQWREEKALFSGDHVMGWSTTIISPPDGDIASYLESLELLLARDDACYWPTHGPCIRDPKPLVEGLIAHRLERAEEIRACLVEGVDRIAEMVPRMYVDLPETMYRAAARSVFSTLIYLVDRGEVSCEGKLDAAARFVLVAV